MFLIDSMMVGSMRWILSTLAQAAMAEMDDDTPLREALIEAAEQLELGEISEEEFAEVEESVLAGIREIRARREGASAAPISLVSSLEESEETLEVEASITGDFHEPPQAPAHAPPRLALPRPAPPRLVRPRRREKPRKRTTAKGRRA